MEVTTADLPGCPDAAWEGGRRLFLVPDGGELLRAAQGLGPRRGRGRPRPSEASVALALSWLRRSRQRLRPVDLAGGHQELRRALSHVVAGEAAVLDECIAELEPRGVGSRSFRRAFQWLRKGEVTHLRRDYFLLELSRETSCWGSQTAEFGAF